MIVVLVAKTFFSVGGKRYGAICASGVVAGIRHFGSHFAGIVDCKVGVAGAANDSDKPGMFGEHSLCRVPGVMQIT